MIRHSGKSSEEWARLIEEIDSPSSLSSIDNLLDAPSVAGVLGWGRSGRSAATFLRRRGSHVVVWDDSETGRAAAAADGFDVVDLTKDAAWDNDAAPEELIVSPGIPHLYPAPHPAVAQALKRGAPLDNDVGLFFKNKPGDDIFSSPHALAPRAFTICVTGSNGKSTTTALIGHIVSTQSAWPVQAGGNIGRPVLDLAEPCGVMIYVLELSSYQLELATTVRSDVNIFLNLSDDHLDRHGGRGGYFAAKARLFRNGGGAAIIGVDEPEGRFLATQMGCPEIIAAGAPQDVWGATSYGYDAGVVTDSGGGRFDLTNAPALQGAHNAQNAAAAIAACRQLALTDSQIQAGLDSFPGLSHRAEPLGTLGGVAWINDSKATNADAAEKALRAYENVRWIAGGVPKSGGLASLAPLFNRVKKAYLIGDAAPEFAQTLAASQTPYEICGDLHTAVARIAAEADPGDTALLSPACASFDQFPNFEARGDAFRALVAALPQETAP